MEKKIKNISNETNIIINSNKIDTSDKFEPIESVLTDLGNAMIDILDVLKKYNITTIDGKGITFKDGYLYLSDSEIFMDNENK